MDTLEALCAALPAVNAAHALESALAAMEAQSGTARVAYASLEGAMPGGATRALARYVRTHHARRAGVHAVVLQPRCVRFAAPHLSLARRRVCVRATEFSAEVSGHVDADVYELGRALDRSLRAAGVEGAFAPSAVRCCQVYWYTGVRTDLDLLAPSSEWLVVARGSPARLRTASGMLSACVYANGTVSLVARCVAQLSRAGAELLAAIRLARAAEPDDFCRLLVKDEAAEDGRSGPSGWSLGSGSDDDDGDFAVRGGAHPPVARTARTKRKPRGGHELRKEGGRVDGDLRGVRRALALE
jgi:hypothetical protein